MLASELKFSDLLNELEHRLDRDLSQSDMELVVQMKQYSSVDKIEEVLRSEGEQSGGRTRRFEGVGTSTLVDITDIPIEMEDDAGHTDSV